jgi:HAD superfamily hydrolase (TIGR01509 family)
MMIKGLIFDFDGLICDTETPELKAWYELFAEYEREFPLNAYLATIGAIYNDTTPVLLLEEMVDDPIDAEKVMSDFLVIKRKLMDQEPLRPGVLDYLRGAEKSDLIIGLASSAPSEWVLHHINRLGVIDYFDCIRTADNISNPKPDPEVYIRALECMGIFPHEVIALEDSPNGVGAAVKSGVNVVAVPNSVTKVFNFDNADLIIDSLTDISLNDLVSIFTENKKP